MTYEERRTAAATADLLTAKNLIEAAGNTLNRDRGIPVAAMCRAALKIVDETYMAAAKLEYEMIDRDIEKGKTNDRKTDKD